MPLASPFRPLSRRTFLASLALAAVANAQRVGAADKSAPIGLGFSLYGLPRMSLDDSLSLCARVGFDSVELSLLSGAAVDAAKLGEAGRIEIREQLAKHNLVAAGLMENMPVTPDNAKHAEQLERIKHAGDLARTLSATPPPLETILGGKPGQWGEFKSLVVDRLGDWARVAEQAGIVICAKPHAAGALNRPEDALWLVKQINRPSLRLAYDYSHYEHRGIPLSDSMRELLPYCPFVHVKDRAAGLERLQFLLPGEGSTDYTQYARLLVANQYHGHVVVEVSGQIHSRPDYDPAKAVTQCYEHLSKKFAAAGVTRPARSR